MYFTTLKVINQVPLFLSNHINDFAVSLHKKNISLSTQLEKKCKEYVKKHAQKNEVYRLNIEVCKNRNFSFFLTPYTQLPLQKISLQTYPISFYEQDYWIKKRTSKRWEMYKECSKNGCSDWIFLNEEKYVLESCIANLFWIEQKKLCYPSRSLPYYFGTTLQNILNVAQKWGYLIEERKATIENLYEASSVLYCNSLKGILKVDQINQVEIKSSPQDQQLMYAYEQLITKDALCTMHRLDQ